ncbi:MAG: nitroreductase family protein [Acidimicrobiales bacterium]
MGHGRGPREAPLSHTSRGGDGPDRLRPTFAEVVRRRRMTRAFLPTAVAPETIDRLLDGARRSPSAGNTAAIEFLVLDEPASVDAYWSTTLPDARRATFPWPQLLDAPVLVIPWVAPAAYVARYAEPDKARTGLGSSIDDWTVPYWFVDGGAAVMSLLLGAEAEGLGALLFGLFEHEDAVRERFAVPADRRAVGAIAIGHRAPDRPSASAGRPRPSLDAVVHRGTW